MSDVPKAILRKAMRGPQSKGSGYGNLLDRNSHPDSAHDGFDELDDNRFGGAGVGYSDYQP